MCSDLPLLFTVCSPVVDYHTAASPKVIYCFEVTFGGHHASAVCMDMHAAMRDEVKNKSWLISV